MWQGQNADKQHDKREVGGGRLDLTQQAAYLTYYIVELQKVELQTSESRDYSAAC